MFDGYETYGLVPVMGPAVHQFLPPERRSTSAAYWQRRWLDGRRAGRSRRRCGLLRSKAHPYALDLVLRRFCWASRNIVELLVPAYLVASLPGAAIVAEFWPPATRGRAGGVLHAAYGVGLLTASGIWLLLNPLGQSSWRYMFVIGILPAFLYVRCCVDEPAIWIAASRDRRKGARATSDGSWLSSRQRTTAVYDSSYLVRP
jgi:hypothetical protein